MNLKLPLIKKITERQLDHYNVLEESVFPNDSTVVRDIELSYKELYFQLDENLNSRIRKISNNSKINKYTFLLTTFYILLSKYKDINTVAIGTNPSEIDDS
ncbi:condensation domain-containing protein [Bacillus pseudomycoides]|uniref:condensation domain-containing protein n=1 Tax=Bacillus pseudomycoides TaxID=64104 RepID=UPI001FB4DCE8|nr:condensation domain-containing protein [Bacillus pseudomycoides]